MHSEPVPTGKEKMVPAGLEGIVLSNFDIANEEEKKHMQQNKLQSNNQPQTLPTPTGDTNETTNTRRRRRSYDYSLDSSRDDVKDCVCATLAYVCCCLCCYEDGE